MITTLANIDIITVVYIGIVIVAAVAMAAVVMAAAVMAVTALLKQTVKDIMETQAILRGRRALQKRNAAPDQQPIDAGLDINKRFSTPLPGVASPEPQVNMINAFPARLDQGMPNMEPVDEEEPQVNMINAFPAGLDQGMPNMEPVNEEEPQVNMIDILPAELAESNQGWPQEKPEELNEASHDGYAEQPITGSNLSDLFNTEVAEEDDISKFAKKLDDVDARDLQEEAQSLISRVRGGNVGHR